MKHDVVQSYYLVAQTPTDLLILGIKGQSNCLRRTASEVLTEPKLFSGLPPEDRALVLAIANIKHY